jgi:hypothetical protein
LKSWDFGKARRSIEKSPGGRQERRKTSFLAKREDQAGACMGKRIEGMEFSRVYGCWIRGRSGQVYLV